MDDFYLVDQLGNGKNGRNKYNQDPCPMQFEQGIRLKQDVDKDEWETLCFRLFTQNWHDNVEQWSRNSFTKFELSNNLLNLIKKNVSLTYQKAPYHLFYTTQTPNSS